MDKAFQFLGICKRAGQLLTGEDGVGGAVRSGDAVLVMTALDTAGNTRKKADNLSSWYHIPHLHLPWEKDPLGELLDKRVCAILALTDRGMAAAFVQKLALQYPDNPEYAALEEQLRHKAARKGRKVND